MTLVLKPMYLLSLEGLIGVCIHKPSFAAANPVVGLSFDKLRACAGLDPVTNDLSVYIPLSECRPKGVNQWAV